MYLCYVKKIVHLILLQVLLFCLPIISLAQCSICTKSAQQLGDKAGRGLNLSILFLAFMPLILIAYIGFRWWKNEKENLS
jgi:amino acid transporter